jgi:hypothetical protein
MNLSSALLIKRPAIKKRLPPAPLKRGGRRQCLQIRWSTFGFGVTKPDEATAPGMSVYCYALVVPRMGMALFQAGRTFKISIGSYGRSLVEHFP